MRAVVVEVADQAQKDLRKVPDHIEWKLFQWSDAVRLSGIEVVRRIPGYHDEPLKGAREGQRSIRLNRFYRAIYEVTEQIGFTLVEIKEVTKHVY